MATTVARLEAILAADTKQFDRAMGKSESTMQKAGKVAGVAGLAIAGGLAFGAKHAINAASNLNEQMNKTSVVFGKSGKDVQRWSRGLTRNFGISSRAALEAAGTFGNMLVPMGIARVKAAAMSKSMVQLAGDMASFNNASPEETLEALRSGLAGETEPLRKFGIFLNQDRIAAEALALGLVKAEVDMAKVKLTQIALTEAQRDAAKALHEHGKGSLEYAKEAANLDYIESKLSKTLEGKIPKLSAAQKAQATYSIITKDTADAAGDFERTSGSLANQQRILRAEVENLSAQLGQNLLPIVVAVMSKVVRATVFFSEHKTATKALVIATAALTAGLLAASAAQLAMNLAVLANPYVAATVAIIALAAGVALLWAKFKELRPVIALVSFYVLGLPAGITLLLAAFGKLDPVLEKMAAGFKAVVGWVKSLVSGIKWLIDHIPDIPSLPSWADPRNIGDVDPNLWKRIRGGGGPSSISPALYDELAQARSFGLRLTSGYRPGAKTKRGTMSDHAKFPSKAIDVAGSSGDMLRFFMALIGNRGVKQAFYDPMGSIFGGSLSSYREGGHSDHVHVATYDKGGWLRPGWNLAYNGLGRPEPVGVGTTNIYLTNAGVLGSEREVMGWLQNAVTRLRKQGGNL